MNDQNITDEELRIAIATACGYVFDHRYKGSRQFAEIVVILKDGQSVGSFFPGDASNDRGKEMMTKAGVPDYPGDLNAMASAVATLSESERHDYAVILSGMFWPNGWDNWRDTLAVSEATAKQRAQAFVRTIAARAGREEKV